MTKNNTHTPGPWHVRKDRRSAHPSSIMSSATCVAKCNEFVRGEEVEGNATLIASAPDLLSACKEAAQVFVVLSLLLESHHIAPQSKKACEDMFERLQAVAASAEGKQ